VIHPTFPNIVVAEAIARVCKGSQSKMTPKLPTLCGEGEHMVMVTRVIYPAMHVMRYESKRIPLVITLDNTLTNTKEKCYIIWEAQFLLPHEL